MKCATCRRYVPDRDMVAPFDGGIAWLICEPCYIEHEEQREKLERLHDKASDNMSTALLLNKCTPKIRTAREVAWRNLVDFIDTRFS